MEKMQVCLCVNVGRNNWRKQIVGKVGPTRGFGYRFNVGTPHEFLIKVKFAYCDVEEAKDQFEGVIGLVWAEADLPKDVTIGQLEKAGFEEFHY
jgi:hypothetical protein